MIRIALRPGVPRASQEDHVVAEVVDLAAWRERAAWEAAVRHLNARGLPAVVPASLVPRLRRLGLEVWPAGERAA